ncbi:MAG: ABC transporter ATP-binding protein [Chlamydiae bacterium]|nr:ABC transporter ATP-binding protein [Chlamydiota bacterium]
MTPLLSIENLQITFSSHGKKIHAVSGVDFSLCKGETLGIVGESGCGKSATAKAIMCLLPPHSTSLAGKIEYQGQNLLTLPEKQMQAMRGKEIGMIFQDPMTSLNPTLKIGIQIIEGYRKHHPEVSFAAAFDYAIEMLHLVGISDPAARALEYPHTLSGGMRQRVMIAIALACKPQILIADEPTTSLDVTIQAQILHLLKEIQKKTATSLILITHDLSVIAGICDRVIVMYAGKIVESAPVNDLFYTPQHPYTQKLIQAIPSISRPRNAPLFSIEGHPPQLYARPAGCSFAPRCDVAMKICMQKTAPTVDISPGHYSCCWLHRKREIGL